MKPRDLHYALSSKLRLRRNDRSKHAGYELRLNEDRLELPRLMTVSQGDSGEVAPQVVGSCARNLGMKEREFLTMARCEIRRECVLFALAMFCFEARERFGLSQARGWGAAHPLAETVDGILKEISSLPGSKLNRSEIALLRRLMDRAVQSSGSGTQLARRIQEWLNQADEIAAQ